MNIGNGAGDQLFVVNGAGSQATLAGPMLSATGTALSLTGAALVEVSTSATLTDTSAQRLVSLSGGTLTLGSAANAFLLNARAPRRSRAASSTPPAPISPRRATSCGRWAAGASW